MTAARRHPARAGCHGAGAIRASRVVGALALMALLVALPRPAAARRRTVLVGPLTPLGIATREARKVHRWLRAALSSVPRFRVRGGRRVVRAVHQGGADCGSKPRCLGRVARRLGASLIVAGAVGSVGEGYVVYARVVSATGRQLRRLNTVVSRRRARHDMRKLAFQLLAPKRFKGKLDVDVDVAGAWIYVDGARVARVKSANKPVTLSLTVGPHALRVTSDRHRDWVRFVRVDFEGRRRVPVALSELAVHSREMRLSRQPRVLSGKELPWYRRWWAVTTFGVVVAAATTVIVALIPRAVGRDASVAVGRP